MLDVLRDGKNRSIALVTAERPVDPDQTPRFRKNGRSRKNDRFGLSTRPLTPNLAARLGYEGKGQLVVTGVATGTAADRAGLRKGDVIEQADRKPVPSARALQAALADGKALLRVVRKGSAFFTVLSKD